jgi:hypothetical protein
MKTTFIFMFLFSLAFTMQAQKPESKNKTLRHVVLVKFKDSSSESEITNVVNEFAALKKSMKQVKAFEWGLNNSPENLHEGLTHAFVLTFSTEKDRDDYLVDPIHKKFVEVAGPHIDKVVVVDYWVK